MMRGLRAAWSSQRILRQWSPRLGRYEYRTRDGGERVQRRSLVVGQHLCREDGDCRYERKRTSGAGPNEAQTPAEAGRLLGSYQRRERKRARTPTLMWSREIPVPVHGLAAGVFALALGHQPA